MLLSKAILFMSLLVSVIYTRDKEWVTHLTDRIFFLEQPLVTEEVFFFSCRTRHPRPLHLYFWSTENKRRLITAEMGVRFFSPPVLSLDARTHVLLHRNFWVILMSRLFHALFLPPWKKTNVTSQIIPGYHAENETLVLGSTGNALLIKILFIAETWRFGMKKRKKMRMFQDASAWLRQTCLKCDGLYWCVVMRINQGEKPETNRVFTVLQALRHLLEAEASFIRNSWNSLAL